MQQMKKHLTPKHVIMAHTTVSPETMRAAAEVVEKRGGQLVDAPFTGSKMAAENGELVYYIAGAEAALLQVRPILQASSKEILEMGRVGDATMIKLATNMVTAASVQAAAEALALVCKSGLPAEHFVAAMQHNGSNSATLEMKLPLMVEGDFSANFSVKHMLKDVVLATRLARSLGLEVGATDAARHALVEEMRQGRGDDDYASLVRQYFPEGGRLTQGPAEGDKQPTLTGLDENTAPWPTEPAPVMMEPEAVVIPFTEVVEEAIPESAASAIQEEPTQSVAEQPAQPSDQARRAYGRFRRPRADS